MLEIALSSNSGVDGDHVISTVHCAVKGVKRMHNLTLSIHEPNHVPHGHVWPCQDLPAVTHASTCRKLCKRVAKQLRGKPSCRQRTFKPDYDHMKSAKWNSAQSWLAGTTAAGCCTASIHSWTLMADARLQCTWPEMSASSPSTT